MDVTLQIPKEAVLHVSEGQKVKINDPFYSIKKTQEVVIPISGPLGVNPNLIFQYSQVVIGTQITQGDLLASVKKMIGTKKVSSSVSGTVLRIDHEEGVIVLNAASEQDKVQSCFFTGEIKSVDVKKSRVTIAVGPGVSVDALMIEGDGGGDVTHATDENYYSLSTDDIQGNAILIHDIASHVFTKLDALDAGGVIYVSGDVTANLPNAKVDEKGFELLSKKPYAYIVFSSHEKKIFAYN